MSTFLLEEHYAIIQIIGGHGIFFGFESMTLREAIAFCNKQGGRVFEPRNFYQIQDVYRFAQNARLLDSYWIGISDLEEEGR